MTINIAVVTSEALVLGCDSISSVTQYFVDPFSLYQPPASETESFSLTFRCRTWPLR
jgi:hypothetical protein